MDTDTLLVLALGLGLALAFMLPYHRRQQRLERETEEAELKALRYGLHEPVSLHPVVDPESCIGTGNCIATCPEETVLGIRNGQAVAIAPARCIGHGLCERACPVDAIKLVFGTESRGVELPRIRENFETNVPGLYIVGELGGMGLIRNAFEQGRQCIEGIVRERRAAPSGALDLLVVGCGPAGLAASLNALHHGLRFATLEKEDVGGTVRHYPRKKLVMTRPFTIPGYGKLTAREIRKEALIDVWEDIIQRTGLRVNTGETVLSVKRNGDGVFTVKSSAGEHHAARVILAIGRRGVPRKLGVPGENSPAVAYSLREPEAFQNDRIVVVGGGDSAIEAALALAEQPGNRVWLSYRGEKFSRIKEENHQRIEQAVAAGQVEVLWSTQLTRIDPGAVHYRTAAGDERVLDADRVFVFIGGELPTRFLRECGVEIDVKFGTA